MAGVIDLWLVYQFLRRLATPFEKWRAYEEGVIDKDGNILIKGKDRNTVAQRDSFGKFDLMILKLKKLLEKLPGGQTKIASYAAALWLIKEHQENNTPLENLTEEVLLEYIDIAEDLNLNHEMYLLHEEMSVGAGQVDGIGYGEKGEPGFTSKQMNKYKKRNKEASIKRFKELWSNGRR